MDPEPAEPSPLLVPADVLVACEVEPGAVPTESMPPVESSPLPPGVLAPGQPHRTTAIHITATCFPLTIRSFDQRTPGIYGRAAGSPHSRVDDPAVGRLMPGVSRV